MSSTQTNKRYTYFQFNVQFKTLETVCFDVSSSSSSSTSSVSQVKQFQNPAALLHRFSVTSKNWTLFLRPSREQSNFSSSHNFQVQLTSLLYAQCATEGGASSLPAPTFRFARRVSSPRLRTDKHPKVLKQRTG